MEDESSLRNLTVLELQQECKRRGLKKNGIKAKLIQRLSEYIGKHGPDYIEPVEKASPVAELSVEKSVLTIHNPHPYMEEYEEQLIENVNTEEEDVNNFFTPKKHVTRNNGAEVNEVKNVDYEDTPDSDTPLPCSETPDSDAQVPYPEAPDTDAPVPSADTPDSDVPLPYEDNPDSDEQLPGSPTYPATSNSVRDPRDMAEELTEPIHKSPTYCKSPNDRIIQLPDENNAYTNNQYENNEDETNQYENNEEESNQYENNEEENNQYKNNEDQNNEDENNEDENIEYKDNEDENIEYKENEDENIDYKDNEDENIDYKDNEDENIDYKDNEDENIDYKDNEDENIDYKDNEDENIEYRNNEDENIEYANNKYADNEDENNEDQDNEDENKEDDDHRDDDIGDDDNGDVNNENEDNENEDNEVDDMCNEEVDAEEKIDVDEVDEKIETNSHEHDNSTCNDEEKMDEIEGDINEALHSEMDADGEADDALDYADDEDNEGNEENEGTNDMEDDEEDGEVEKENGVDNENYVEEPEECMDVNESRDLEDGEITVNVENLNEFEEHQGDDHLDVSIQDYKIIEDNEADDTELAAKTPKKTVVPVSLKKRISLVASTESPEERAARRKRRWGSTSTSMRESGIAISSESIKKLIPDMKIDAAALESVPELDYQEDDVIENVTEVVDENVVQVDTPETSSPPKIYKTGRSVKVDSAKKITLDKPSSTTQDVVTVESDSGDLNSPITPAAQPPAPSIRNYVVDDEVEVQEEREKSPSPAKNPSSQYIHIENLVRPYTISQLKSVIGRTGHICDGGFWINNIKSQCYVKLSSELESAATRDALHGLRWPAGSPKLLKIDFALNEQMYKETTGLLGEKPKIVIEIEDKETDQVVITNERTRGSRREENNYDRRMRNDGKKRIPPPPLPPPKDTEKEREKEKRVGEREESPAKLLDDLFRKTKATPCIYWLPLTDEQILRLSNIRTSESQRR